MRIRASWHHTIPTTQFSAVLRRRTSFPKRSLGKSLGPFEGPATESPCFAGGWLLIHNCLPENSMKSVVATFGQPKVERRKRGIRAARGTKRAADHRWSQRIPAGRPANTGLAGDKSPDRERPGLPCLVERQGLELWTEGSEVLSARSESFVPRVELAHGRVTA
jgi:hypothetical protein